MTTLLPAPIRTVVSATVTPRRVLPLPPRLARVAAVARPVPAPIRRMPVVVH